LTATLKLVHTPYDALQRVAAASATGDRLAVATDNNHPHGL